MDQAKSPSPAEYVKSEAHETSAWMRSLRTASPAVTQKTHVRTIVIIIKYYLKPLRVCHGEII